VSPKGGHSGKGAAGRLIRRGESWVLFIFVSLVYGGILYSFATDRFRPLPLGGGERVSLMVEEGMSALDVARAARAAGLVSDDRLLAEQFKARGIERSLRPGLYFLRAGAPYEVARQMGCTVPEVRERTLIPGRDAEDLPLSADLPGALARLDNFPEAVRPLLPPESGDARGRVAFLLPETYRVAPGPGEADRLVRSASSAWWRVFSADIVGLPPGRVQETAVLASLIEREVRSSSERPLVAGLFLNRLERNMPLQSCASVVYAWRRKGVRLSRVSLKSLEIESPFNTYRRRGLPPEPIALPSQASWAAAFRPVRSPYLYFVARGDGTHVFSRTFEEHLRAKRLLRDLSP